MNRSRSIFCALGRGESRPRLGTTHDAFAQIGQSILSQHFWRIAIGVGKQEAGLRQGSALARRCSITARRQKARPSALWK